MRPKRKSTKSASGDGDVPLVKKPRKSKVMNKKERDSLKLQFLLNHQISRSYIADKLKAEKSLSEKFKQFANSLLGKDQVIKWHHCIPSPLLCCTGCFRLGIFMADLSYHSPDDTVMISFSHAN